MLNKKYIFFYSCLINLDLLNFILKYNIYLSPLLMMLFSKQSRIYFKYIKMYFIVKKVFFFKLFRNLCCIFVFFFVYFYDIFFTIDSDGNFKWLYSDIYTDFLKGFNIYFSFFIKIFNIKLNIFDNILFNIKYFYYNYYLHFCFYIKWLLKKKIFYSYYNFFLIIFFLSFKYTYFSSFLYCIYEHLSILNICFFTFYYNIINIIFINIISIFIDYYRISELLYYKDDYVLFFINSIYNSRIFTPILVTDIFKINSIMQHFIFYDTAIYKNCINIFCILGEYMYFFKSTNITFFLLLYFFIILFYRKCIFIGYQLFIMRKMLYNVLYARIFNKKYFKYYLNIALIESESIECSVAINYKLFKHFEELPIILFIGLMVPCMFSFKHPVPVYNEVTLPEIEYFEDELVDLNSLEYEYLYNDGFVNEKSGQYLLSLGQKYFFRSTLDYYDDFEINDYDNYVNLLLKEELFNYNIIPLNNYNFFFNSFEEILVLKKFFEQNNIFYNYLKLTNNPFLAKTKLFVSEYKSLDLLIKQESIYNSILKLKFDDIKTMDQIRYWDSANIDRIHDCFYGAILNYSEFFDYSYIVHNSELLHTISQYDLFIFDNNLIIKFLKKKFNTIFLKKGILNTDLDYINLENHFIYGRSLQFSFKFSSNALLDSYYEFLYLYGVINNKDILLPYINSFYKSFYYFPPKLIFDKVPYFMDIFFCTTENNGKDGSHLERFLYYMDMECIGIDILDMLYKDYKYTSSKLKYDLINVYNYGKDENVVLEKIKYIKTIKVGNLEIHICDPHYVMLKSTKSYYKYLLEQYNVIGSLFEGPIRIFNFYEIQMKNFCNESFVAKHLFFYKNNMSFMSYKYMEYYEMFKYSKFLSDGYKPLWFLQNNNQKYYNLKYNNIFHNYNIEQKKNENLDFFGKSKLDVPHIDQVNFQDSATPTMEGLIDFHHELVFFMILISIFVSIFLLFIVFNFKNNIIRDFINYKKPLLVSHNTILEIIWTIIPGIILFAIAVPSFALLYAMDEVINPGITLKVIGHQWFWSYEYGDPLPQFKKVSEQVHVKNLLNIPKVVKRLRERREAVLYTERMEIVQEAFRNLILKELMKRNGNIEKYKKILIKIDYMQTLLYTLDGVKVIKERQKKTKIFANNENYLYKSSQDNPSVILADKAARYKRVDVIEELNKFLKNEEIQEALDYYESNLRSEDSIKKFKNAFLKGKRRSIREILRESSLYKEIRDKKIYGFNYYNKKIKLYFLNEVEALYNDLYFGQINPTPCNDELVSFSNFLVQDIDLLHRDGLSLNQRRLLDINSDISSISMIYGDDFIIAQKRQKTDKLGLNIMQSDIFRNVWLNDFFEKASRIEKYRKMVNMPMVSWETCLGDPFYSFSGLGFISDRLSKQSMYLTENFDYYINIKSDNFKLLLELREKVLSTYLITYYPNFFYFIYRKNEKNYICPDVYDLDIIKTVHEFLMYDKGEGLYNFTGLLGPDSSDVVDIYEHWDEYVVDDFESLRTGVDQYICKLYFYLSYNEIYKKRIVNNFRTLKNDQYKNNYYFIKMQHVVSSLNTGEIKSYNIFFNKNYFPIDEGAEVILRFISDYSDPYRKLNYIKINQSIEIDYATVLTQKKDEETLNNSIDYLEQFKFNYPLKNFNDIKLKKNLTKDQTKYMLFLGFRDLLNVVYISSYFSRLSDNKVNEICENAVDIFLEKYENELRISYNKDAVGNIFEQKKLNDLFFIVVESIKDAANKKQNYVNYELDYSSELNFSSSILHLKDQINKKYLKMFNKNDILNFIENQIKINNYLVTEEVINKLAIIYKEHLAKEIYYLNSLLNKHGLESITIQEYSIKKPFTLYSDDILNDFYDNNIIISQSIGKGFIDISDISTDKYFLNEIQNRFKLNNILIKESSFTIGSVLKSYVYSFFESFKVHNFSNSDNKDVLNVLSKLKLNPVRDFKLNYNKHSILLDDKVELLNTINFWITKKISDDDFFYKFEDFQNKYRLDSPEVVDDFHKIIYKICNFTKKELVYDLENQYLIYKFYDRNSYFFKRFSTFTFAKEVFSNIDGICIEKESEKEFNYIYNFKFSNFYNNKPMYLTNFLENKKVSGKIRLGRYAVLKMYTHYSKKYKDVSLDFTSFYRIISENIAQISLTKMYYKGENLKENYSYFSPEDYYPIYSQLLKNYFNVMKSTSYEKLKYPINRKVFLNQMELIFQLYSTNPTIFNINLESDKSILMFTTYLKYFFRWAKINDEFYLPLLMSKYFKNNKLFLADKSKYDFIKGFIKSYENIKPLGEYVYNPTENELKTIFSLNSFESLNQMMVFYVNYTVMPTVCKLFGSKNSLFHVGNYLNNKSKVILEDIDIYRNLSNYRLNNLTENIRYSRNYLNKSFVTSFYDFTLEDLKLNKKNNIKTVSNIHKLKFVIPEKVTLNEYENFLNIGVCQVIGDYKKSLKINKVHSSFSNGISKYNYMFADVYNNLFQKYFEVRDLNNHIFLLKDLFNYKKRLRYLIEERDVSNSISYIKSEMLARESKLIDSYGNNYLHKYEDTVFQKDIKQKKILYSKSCVDDTLDDNEYLKEDSEYGWLIDNAKEFSIYYKKSCNDIYLNLRSLYNPDRSIELIDEHTPVINDSLREVYMFDSRLYINMELSSEMKDIMLERFGKAIYKLQLNNVSFDKDTLWLWRTYNRMMSFVESMEDITLPHDSLSISYQGYGAYHRYLIFCSTVPPISSHTSVLKTVENLNVQKYIRLKKYNQIFFNKLKDFNENYFKSLSDKYVTCNLFYQKNFNMILGQNELMLNPSKYFLKNIFNYVNYSQDIFLETILKNSKKSTYNNIFYKQCLNFLENNGKEYYFSKCNFLANINYNKYLNYYLYNISEDADDRIMRLCRIVYTNLGDQSDDTKLAFEFNELRESLFKDIETYRKLYSLKNSSYTVNGLNYLSFIKSNKNNILYNVVVSGYKDIEKNAIIKGKNYFLQESYSNTDWYTKKLNSFAYLTQEIDGGFEFINFSKKINEKLPAYIQSNDKLLSDDHFVYQMALNDIVHEYAFCIEEVRDIFKNGRMHTLLKNDFKRTESRYNFLSSTKIDNASQGLEALAGSLDRNDFSSDYKVNNVLKNVFTKKYTNIENKEFIDYEEIVDSSFYENLGLSKDDTCILFNGKSDFNCFKQLIELNTYDEVTSHEQIQKFLDLDTVSKAFCNNSRDNIKKFIFFSIPSFNFESTFIYNFIGKCVIKLKWKSIFFQRRILFSYPYLEKQKVTDFSTNLLNFELTEYPKAESFNKIVAAEDQLHNTFQRLKTNSSAISLVSIFGNYNAKVHGMELTDFMEYNIDKRVNLFIKSFSKGDIKGFLIFKRPAKLKKVYCIFNFPRFEKKFLFNFKGIQKYFLYNSFKSSNKIWTFSHRPSNTFFVKLMKYINNYKFRIYGQDIFFVGDNLQLPKIPKLVSLPELYFNLGYRRLMLDFLYNSIFLNNTYYRLSKKSQCLNEDTSMRYRSNGSFLIDRNVYNDNKLTNFGNYFRRGVSPKFRVTKLLNGLDDISLCLKGLRRISKKVQINVLYHNACVKHYGASLTFQKYSITEKEMATLYSTVHYDIFRAQLEVLHRLRILAYDAAKTIGTGEKDLFERKAVMGFKQDPNLIKLLQKKRNLRLKMAKAYYIRAKNTAIKHGGIILLFESYRKNNLESYSIQTSKKYKEFLYLSNSASNCVEINAILTQTEWNLIDFETKNWSFYQYAKHFSKIKVNNPILNLIKKKSNTPYMMFPDIPIKYFDQYFRAITVEYDSTFNEKEEELEDFPFVEGLFYSTDTDCFRDYKKEFKSEFLQNNVNLYADRFYNVRSGNILIKFDSYMLPEDELIEGMFRNLEVDQRVFLPEKVHVRVLVTADDVLHSWAIPSLGVKMDACPGRLNQTEIFSKRTGVFYGQCSEICGINHGFMPIVIEIVNPNVYANWIYKKFLGK